MCETLAGFVQAISLWVFCMHPVDQTHILLDALDTGVRDVTAYNYYSLILAVD